MVKEMNTGSMCTLILQLLLVAGMSNARSVNQLCRSVSRNYIKHPTDCEKFIQCHGTDNKIGDVLNCPFPTYWSNEVLTCLSAENVACDMDKCADLPDGSFREGYGNCRGYWECHNGKSMAKCCPLGQRFEKKHGCIDTGNEDDECKDTCLGISYDMSNETANETEVCNKSPIVNQPNYYLEVAAGMQFTRPCPVGTVFNQDECNCVRATEPVNKAECKREIYLPFNTDHKDMSGNRYFIGNENVDVENGEAHFNSSNSRLSIPFFNNMEHVDAIVIRINYTSDSRLGDFPQVIMSNSECGFLPSIVISENKKDVIFKIGTTKNRISSVAVPQPHSLQEEKTLEFKFLNENLIGSVNKISSDVAVNGFLRNVQCDLSIGGIQSDMSYFQGSVSELSVYMCNPDSTN